VKTLRSNDRLSHSNLESMNTSADTLLKRLLARARLRHLQVLTTVAELGSLRRAGAAVGLSQPAVSHALADLEGLLGVSLFHRHARGVRPTEAAQALLPVARRMLATLAEGAEGVAAQLAQVGHVVRLSASASAMNGLLGPLLPALATEEPQLRLLVTLAEAAEFQGRIARGETDAVACRRPAVLPAGWQFHPLLEDELVVAAAPNHPLAGLRRVALAQLADQTWAVPPAPSLAGQALDALVAEQGWQPRIASTVTRELVLTWSLLRAPKTLALVPSSVVRLLVEAGALSVLKLQRHWPIEPLGLLLPEGASAAEARHGAASLLRFARRQLQLGA
jgi:DNA-binding transcriptional LysR family regulator